VSAPRAIREEAARWLDRLQRENGSEEAQAAFARWHDESPEHQLAYEAVERTWRHLQEAGHEPHVLALRHETALRMTRRTSRRAGSGYRVAAAMVLVVAGLAVAVGMSSRIELPPPVVALLDRLSLGNQRTYRTQTGERLAITLQDGSQVTLNTRTEIETAFGPAERKILLRHGQVLFNVAKDPRRPFVVETQGRRLVAVGTSFDVRVEGGRVQVTMVEGTVRVEPAGESTARARSVPDEEPSEGNAAARESSTPPGEAGSQMPQGSFLLSAGEQMVIEASNIQRVRLADAEKVTSWRIGQVIFERARLADAIAELNRYSETQIQLADPALADLELSGAFATGRTAVFIEALTAYFPIEVAEANDRAIVLRARQEPQ